MTFLDVIDLRSFSSIWYWLLVGTVWTRVMHAPMGVPVDLARRAARGGAAARADLLSLVRIEARARRDADRALGPWRAAAWSFLLTSLAVLAAYHRIEIALAALLVLAPLAVVRWLSTRMARGLADMPADADSILPRLARLRWQVQAVGVAAVFFSAVVGMIHSLAVPAVP
jgi:hypothetical protein